MRCDAEDPAILARIDDDRVEFDLRSVREDELEELAAGVERAFSEISPARGSKALERRD